jgi:hypothetical protein
MRDLGINSVMDQLMTPYPSTEIRQQLIDEGRVRNPDDFRWYDGYFSNVATDHYEPAELNFMRWKMRREVLGMWRAKPEDWRYFAGYSLLWELGLRPLVWLHERYAEMRYGIEGRYKLQMKHYLDLNDFDIEGPGLERSATYHPVFGDASDPYHESREQLLARTLEFSPPRPASVPAPLTDPA